MSTTIIPVSSTENFIKVVEITSFTEEDQLTFDEQLMLDREAYSQASKY